MGGPNRASDAFERHADGDVQAFDVVYVELSGPLQRFLESRVRNRERAEDLVQETFTRMHRARSSFVRGSDVLPWAFAIARNVAFDEMRQSRTIARTLEGRAKQEVENPQIVDGPDDEFLAGKTAEQIGVALESLPEKQRLCFELVRLADLSYAQAAETLETTVDSVKLRVHRATEALRIVLGLKEKKT